MNKISLKSFLVYGIGSIARSGISFFLLPLYLHSFDASKYGVLSILTVIMSLSSIFVNAGVISGLFRLYYDAGKEEKKELLGATWIWYFLGGIIVSIILLGYSPQLSKYFFKTLIYSKSLQYLGIFMMIRFLIEIPFTILRLENKSVHYVLFSIVQIILEVLLKIIFIAYLGRGISGYYESGVIAGIVLLFGLLPFTFKYVRLNLKINHYKNLIQLGAPFILSSIAVWVLTISDRFILNYFHGSSEVGIYSLADKFASIFNIVLFRPSALFWAPFFFSFASNNKTAEIKKLLNNSLRHFILLGSIIYLLIVLGYKDILYILVYSFGAKTEYLLSLNLIPILTIAPFLYMLTRQASYALLYIKKPIYSAITSCIAAIVNIILNIILIPYLKAMGAAIATIIAYIIYEVIIYLISQRKYKVEYNWFVYLRILIYLILSFLVGGMISIKYNILSLFIKEIIGIGLFILLIYYDRSIIIPEEKNKIRNKLNKILYEKSKSI